MKLAEALMELREKNHLIGVFQELINHLDSIQESEGQVPIHNSTEEFVDAGYIDEVRGTLTGQVDALIAERKKILDWSVEDGSKAKTAAPKKRARRAPTKRPKAAARRSGQS
tara:strand:+ start:722 stop:1057 length:336 start_codon:yes stop_codon:yes gene_type:complete